MFNMTFIEADGATRDVKAVAGATVMEVAVRNGVNGIEAACGGACSCATCHVYVDAAWTDRLPAPDAGELGMLEFAEDVREASRLGCQIRLTAELDGLKVF